MKIEDFVNKHEKEYNKRFNFSSYIINELIRPRYKIDKFKFEKI